MKAELPGMKREEIDISVSGDTMTIKGEHETETGVKKKDYHLCERFYGSFFRSISLPSAVDTENIEASYQNGVLEVPLPKDTEIEPKKVEISV